MGEAEGYVAMTEICGKKWPTADQLRKPQDQNLQDSWHQWIRSVILATQEAEISRVVV
jgi:hypothetical protein